MQQQEKTTEIIKEYKNKWVIKAIDNKVMTIKAIQ